MASYPNAIPSFTNPTSSNKLGGSTVTHSNQHININDEVLAIATELGTDPAGNFSTVVARLNAISSTDSYWVDDGSGNISYGALGSVTIDDDTANGICLYVNNDGTNHGLYISQDGVLATDSHGLYVYSNAAQVNANGELFYVKQNNASSTIAAAAIANVGTGHGLQISQSGVLAGGKSALDVYSNAVNVNADSALIKIDQDNASSTEPCLEMKNDGNGTTLEIDSNGTGAGIALYTESVSYGVYHQHGGTGNGYYLLQNGTLGGGYNALHIADGAGQGVPLLGITGHASTTNYAALATLTGAGGGLGASHTTTALAGGQHLLYAYSTAANTTADTALIKAHQSSASASQPCIHAVQAGDGDTILVNDGAQHGIRIANTTTKEAGYHCLEVSSSVAQTNSTSYLVGFNQGHASSDQATLHIQQNGSGDGIFMQSSGTGSGIYLAMSGVLAASDHGLFVDASVANVNADSALVKIRQDHASSTEPALEIQNDGTGPSIEYTGYIQGPGSIVQVVNTQTGAVDTGSTVIVNDDTIPQNDEGDEYMTRAITPKSATNKLKIDVVCSISHSAGGFAVVALFQDTTAGALAAVFESNTNVNLPINFKFTHYMDAGTTSETTFKIRAGFANVGTTTFNGSAGGRKLGGVAASSITITEIGV